MNKHFLPKLLFILTVISTSLLNAYQAPSKEEVARWEQHARNVTIIRDDWGIAHVHGKTDADAVFGMEYTQAEDDFNRVETNYLNAMGRLAEAEGDARIYQDLRMKLFINPEELKKQYVASPEWLKKLMDAFADGLNYYLAKHPNVKPKVIQHFEPWMALSFTEGSIGGDIERVNLRQLEDFYGKARVVPMALDRSGESTQHYRAGLSYSVPQAGLGYVSTLNGIEDGNASFTIDGEPTGSNGMAIAPSNTATHHALLLINPHTSFYFRSELQMTSDEGLNAYGAVTWGQFFIYQGFNERTGWMHTSSGVDAVDEYLETVEKRGDKYFYKYGSEWRPMIVEEITVPFMTHPVTDSKRTYPNNKFFVYRTHHGPLIREANGKWVSVALMQKPIEALTQSYTRTKTHNYKEFRATMDLFANSSNNTIFADADGDIAYFHGNFIPRRDTKFDFTKPVDGSDPATDWHGLLTVNELPQLLNPKSGWLYNSNNAPWSAAGSSSPKKGNFPAYVEQGGESARGLHAVKVLQNKKDFTLESLRAVAYDSYLTWFDKPLPALIKAWDDSPATDPLKTKLTEQIKVLRTWDKRWAVDSVATSLAVFWGEDIRRQAGADARAAGIPLEEYLASKVSWGMLLQSLANASNKLNTDFGTWKTPWGDINRFQRLNDDIAPSFNDTGASIPVGFTSAIWGSLASFGARAYPGTKKWYGTSGNSFVAVVEFGEKVRALAVTAGGESGDSVSTHFNDQAKRYSTGDLREVYFYREQLKGHIQREYHPGE